MKRVYTRHYAQRGPRKKGLGWEYRFFGDPNDKQAASELSIWASTTWKRGRTEVVNTTVTGSKKHKTIRFS